MKISCSELSCSLTAFTQPYFFLPGPGFVAISMPFERDIAGISVNRGNFEQRLCISTRVMNRGGVVFVVSLKATRYHAEIATNSQPAYISLYDSERPRTM